MRIALLTPGGVDRSGTGKVIPCLLALIERLAQRGHDVQVFAAAQEPEPDRWQLLGATVHNAGRSPTSVRMIAQLVREHRNAAFDVIHAFWARYGVVGAVAGGMLRVPVVLTLPGGDVTGLHDIGYGSLTSLGGRLGVRLAVSACAEINTPSKFMQGLAAARGITADVVALGADPNAFPRTAPRERRESAPLQLLHVASLNRVKDQTVLLEAVARLIRGGLACELNILGEDTLGGQMQAFASALGIGDAVHFHGLIPFEQLAAWYQRADLLVVSSRHEAGPLAMLEAALSGIPTIGTRVGHLADLAPEAAVAVPVGDYAQLAREIEALARDEPRRLRLAKAAQAFSEQHDAVFTCAAMEGIYGRVAARRAIFASN